MRGLNLIRGSVFSMRKAAHFLLEALIFGSVLVFSFFAPLFWTLDLLGQGALAWRLANGFVGFWCRCVFKVLGCRVEVEGLEHLPADSPCVVFSNHQSNYDALLLMGYLDSSLSFIAKRELFRVPGLAFWMRRKRCLWLDREDIRGGGEALVAYGRELKARRGRTVIFPEGSRSKHPRREIERFLGGSMILALENALPVLPVALDGTRLAGTRATIVRTPRGQRLLRLRITPLIQTGKNDPGARKRLLEEVRKRMVSNWEAIRVEWPVEGDSPAADGYLR